MLFICLSVLPAIMSVYHMHVVSSGAGDRVADPLGLELCGDC